MNTQPQLIFILIAIFGSICQELLYWYELRNKLDAKENKKLLHSKPYWVITFVMIVVSGIGTWLIFYDKEVDFPNKIPFVLGAAFPLVFKKIVAALQPRHLGDLKTAKAKVEYSFEDVSKIYFK
ncbi:hypothetical protein QFZ48_000177 [Chitinophaga sp. W2I13]|uniref:hypothetical protein n=1 Tax=Chitinophaga sp. W2I13 TaxID=3373923 RepID=UPI003D2441C6